MSIQREKVVRGISWSFASRSVIQMSVLVRTIILARMLMPADFGLAGIAMIAVGALEAISVTGCDAALIQRKDNITKYLDTVWTVSLLRGIALCALLMLSSKHIARFFETPNAEQFLMAVALLFVIKGMMNPGVVYFSRELNFKKLFFANLFEVIFGITVALAWAIRYHDAWALILGLLAGALAKTVSSFWLHPYRPRIEIHAGKTKELLGFGRWIFGTNLLGYFVSQVDSMVVGKILGTAQLGFYQMAMRIANTPTTEVTHVLTQVAFPTYAKLQDDISLKDVYLAFLKFVSFFAVFMAGGIFLFADEIVRILLGAKWLPVVVPLQIIAVYGLLRSWAAACVPLYYGVGQPSLDFKITLIRAVIVTVTVYPLSVKWGIAGTAASILIGLLATMPLWYRYTKLILVVEGRKIIAAIGVPLISLTVVWMLQSAIHGIMPGFSIMLRFVIYVVGYFVILVLISKITRYDAFGMFIKEYFKIFKKGRTVPWSQAR